MRVKRLEIQGFKSFKDKTVIHFDHTITGIVGPNGCGKSNIVDAFFWVMGEQSVKHMRGTNSSDLIFNGSSRYAALSMAEATLVLEVIDPAVSQENGVVKKEISVTRRMYRSGEGEYFINHSPARLKDIHELFMDTGVGTKGYSVIEQGQIGKIVNAKPEERRLLIEEAAGIAKYKARKKESLRKMETTQTNLLRLKDIVAEIEKNVVILDKQAVKARQAQALKTELQSIEVCLGYLRISQIDAQLELLEKKMTDFSSQTDSLDTQKQTAENQMESQKCSALLLSQKAEELSGLLEQTAEQLSEKKSGLQLFRQRKQDASERLEDLLQEKAQLEQEQSGLQEGHDILCSQLKKAQDDLKVIQDQQESQAIDFDQLKKTMDELKLSLSQAQNACFENEKKTHEAQIALQTLQSKRQFSEDQLSQIAFEQSQMQEKREQSAQELLELTEKKQHYQEQRQDLLLQQKAFEEKKEQQTAILKNLFLQKEECHKRDTQIEAKLASLQELMDSAEGMSDGPKNLLSWAKKENKELHRLLDGVFVKPGYEALVEAFLDTACESFKGGADDSLRQAVEFAQSTGSHVRFTLGQALTSEKSENSPVFPSALQAVGLLSDFVQVSEEYRFLFENTWVVQSLDPLLDLLSSEKAFLSTHHLVGLDHRVWLAPGTLICTSASKSKGFLQRASQIAQLKEEKAQSALAYQKAEQDYGFHQEQMDLDQKQTQQFTELLVQIDKDIAALHAVLHQLQRSGHDLDQMFSRLNSQMQQAQQSLDLCADDYADALERLSSLKEDREQLLENLTGVQQVFQQRQDAFETTNRSYQASHIAYASLSEQVQGLHREVQQSQNILRSYEKRQDDATKGILRYQQESVSFEDTDEQFAEQIDVLTTLLAEQKQAYAGIKDELEMANQAIAEQIEVLRSAQKNQDEVQKSANQLFVQKEKALSERIRTTEGLFERYGENCFFAYQENPPAELSASEQKQSLQQADGLKEQLKQIGDVNPMAIQEYDQAKNRFDHLKKEQNDLENSLVNLNQAIDHINKTSEVRFEQAFNAIAERFEKLFPIIFGGGSAKLELVKKENNADLMDAGVDILAQPPGKKVSNITLLSGGEKALTAVSLIFAIFMVKPSPFCVLDEVDAPLDDANIGRFNALLREMSFKSQFILITHNKKTMELNDTLYGVTMEEPGVSKMVSIQLH